LTFELGRTNFDNIAKLKLGTLASQKRCGSQQLTILNDFAENIAKVLSPPPQPNLPELLSELEKLITPDEMEIDKGNFK
jgi:hypothetical protein